MSKKYLANKSDVYTKTETDTEITKKVAEIVSGAPEDFDTLKEMSDWIAGHEDDATAMNSAIQTNANNISSLQTDKIGFTDYASTSKAGIVKVNNTYGTGMNNNTLELISATEDDINTGSNDWKPITPYKVPKVMKKYGINSETQIAEMQSDIANKVDNDIFVAENIIKCPYGSKHGTIGGGVTFTYDDDGVVHLVGTCTSTVEPFALVSGLTLSGTYTLSVDNADVYLRVLGIDESGGTHIIGSVINGEPTTFTIGSENENIYPSYKVVVRVIENKIYDSYFKPMLEIGSIAHRYQPYSLSRKAMRDDITVYNDIFVAENLIHYPYNNDTATSGGITFTDNEDGSIAVTGSVTKANTNYNYKLNPNEYTKLEIGQTYILNNCGDLDGDCYLRLFYKADNGTETYLASTKNGSYTFVATETINEVRIWITVNCDDTTKEFNNVIKPMLEIGSIAHRYQPYQLSKQSMRDDINALMALLTNKG